MELYQKFGGSNFLDIKFHLLDPIFFTANNINRKGASCYEAPFLFILFNYYELIAFQIISFNGNIFLPVTEEMKI